MKKKIYKLFLVLLVSLSLSSGAIAQNELVKMLKTLSGTGEVQVQELDEEDKESGLREREARNNPYNQG